MNEFFDWGKAVIIRFGEFEITLSQVLVLTLGIVVVAGISILLTRIIKKHAVFSGLSERLRKLIARGVNYFVWIVGLIALLRIENVDTKGFFEYVIISGDVITFTVQKLFILIVLFFFIRLVVLVVDYAMNRKIQKDNLDYGKAKSLLQITKYFIGLWVFFLPLEPLVCVLLFSLLPFRPYW